MFALNNFPPPEIKNSLVQGSCDKKAQALLAFRMLLTSSSVFPVRLPRLLLEVFSDIILKNGQFVGIQSFRFLFQTIRQFVIVKPGAVILFLQRLVKYFNNFQAFQNVIEFFLRLSGKFFVLKGLLCSCR